MSKDIIPVEHIESKILTIRGQKVILDADLAAIYGVKTKALNQAVKRNIDRFPLDFVFQLSRGEFESGNRSQSVTGSQKHRDPRFLKDANSGQLSAVSLQHSAFAIFVIPAKAGIQN